MRPNDPAARPVRPTDEDGYVLIAVVFMIALVTLSLAVAASKIASQIQRDRELEAINRGNQYKRALRLYYKKFQNYPTSLDQLEKTNDIRYLRKRYVDPMTGKDDWVPIMMGQAHVKPLGFFGQALSSTSMVSPGVGTGSTDLSSSGSSSSSSSGSSAGSSFGSSSGSSFGSSSMGSTGMSGTGTTTASTGSSSGLYAPDDPSTTNGSGTGSTSSGTSSSFGGSGSSFGSSSSSSSSSSLGSSSGTTSSSGFSSTLSGNGPIVGFKLPLQKSSILQYRLKTKYNEWEFVYDPVEERAAAAANLAGGGSNNLNGSSSGTDGTGTGIGSSSGSSIGSGSGLSGLGSSGASSSSFGGGSTISPTTSPNQ